MIRQENPNFKASRFAPNPLEVSYWIDLTTDPNGGSIKVYNGTTWKPIASDSNSDVKVKIEDLEENKVDKSEGKGLSTNDYTTLEKEKLAGLFNYILPEASSSAIGGVYKGIPVANLDTDAELTDIINKINELLASLKAAQVIGYDN